MTRHVQACVRETTNYYNLCLMLLSQLREGGGEGRREGGE